ncbi:hypothetical protein [Acidocella sp.]|jgi:hypothetical protein|uniref:hypothetical protein n=1 Tax=Acidocella sp. TaxID=50710 RepID=UPI002F3F9197
MRPKHPLLAWIERQALPSGKRLRVYSFARLHKFDYRTLYLMLDPLVRQQHDGDKPRLPNIKTLKRIEEVTGGEVTIRQCLDWYDMPPADDGFEVEQETAEAE